MGITEIFLNYYQYFLRGTQTTVIVSLITVLLGTVLGCLIALLRLSKFRLCAGFAKLYITVIRGTPLLVQLYIVYYQLHFIPWPEGSILGVELARVMPCILALSMNSTAYVAEVIRSGIQAVDFGQTEAALSCGKNQDKQQNRRALLGQFPFSAHGDLTSFLTGQLNRVGRCVSNCPGPQKTAGFQATHRVVEIISCFSSNGKMIVKNKHNSVIPETVNKVANSPRR